MNCPNLQDVLNRLIGGRVPEIAKKSGRTTSTLYGWLANPEKVQYRRPEPSALGDVLDAVEATPEQRAEVWEALRHAPPSTQADAARSRPETEVGGGV